ncbi:MAG: ZIP family metal transporter [Candidatus Diapherotrites archaeon CG11_big_fil_rev_8_21_14_0_20_37_9]|nr:MAG: ZIP family metal transporter [Candidatus Diapherotrites archaeon CG11_big_fil_rev_8_21_14_0_20_37_9]
MIETWVYAIASVIGVSLISLIGIFTISINEEKLHKYIHYAVSLSAGALFGDAFLHLLPEAVEKLGFTIEVSAALMAGILFSFAMEKFIRWNHCHEPTSKDHPHPFAIMNLVGDAVHNFIDGLIIGASFLVSIPLGITTSVAVLFHEIPQEIGDYAVLIKGGFSKGKALMYNFGSALTAVAGAIIALLIGSSAENIALLLTPFAAGVFIYIAGSDLIPELHKHEDSKISVIEFIALALGFLMMVALLFLEI